MNRFIKTENYLLKTNSGLFKNKKTIFFISILLVILITVTAFLIFLSSCYSADTEAIAAYTMGDGVSVREIYPGAMAYGNDNASTGLIFYPGGRVEYTSYEPLMRRLAGEDILCVICEMPLNLAFFDSDAADRVIDCLPSIEKWYIGGHSLGGSMAASYLESHAENLEGLILLGSYSISDISASGKRVLSVVGTEDGVLNRDKYAECRDNLPNDHIEREIIGANHAYFGMYGEQDGDGTAQISNEEQITVCASLIHEFISEGEQTCPR